MEEKGRTFFSDLYNKISKETSIFSMRRQKVSPVKKGGKRCGGEGNKREKYILSLRGGRVKRTGVA